MARVIYELVTRYMPNAVVNIERNGGYGASVTSKLMKTSIKRNLFYEIKDKVIEERVGQGGTTIKTTQRTKVYGLDSSKEIRNLLMEILRERMEHHKDKFIAPIIFSELEGLEVKRNGKIEHSSQSHDDQIFSYLMALYVWYEGKDIMERYGVRKQSIKSDADFEEGIDKIEERYKTNIAVEIETISDEVVQRQLEILKDKSKLYDKFLAEETTKDNQAMENLLNTKLGRKIYEDKYHIDLSERDTGIVQLPTNLFTDFYNDN